MDTRHSRNQWLSWNRKQAVYWSTVAPAYDSLYESPWSQRENAWVLDRLSFLSAMDRPRILDLGCGTGLGAALVREWTSLDGYFGIDICPRMVATTESTYGVSARVSSMDDLPWISSGSVDAVIALFSSISYSPTFAELLSEVARVLKPGGRAYLSALGRSWPLRRREGYYRTRGRRLAVASVPARRLRASDLEAGAASAGFECIKVEGMNALSGWCENISLWETGERIARAFPDSSHLLELSCSKPPLTAT